MIKFDKTEVFNWEGAIRGMRNPMNSWNKSDSDFKDKLQCYVGENDLKLMKTLVNAGTDHSKFMRQIMVSVDITAPLYWWSEYDTYKVGTVANSCSKMHKIMDKPFQMNDFSTEHLNSLSQNHLYETIDNLNYFRDYYIQLKEINEAGDVIKNAWWQVIQLLPNSYNQLRTATSNYAVIRNMYHARKNHKLDEWSIGFTEWVKSLPYAQELIINKNSKEEK